MMVRYGLTAPGAGGPMIDRDRIRFLVELLLAALDGPDDAPVRAYVRELIRVLR